MGVREGNQKSGNFALRASACSASIFFNAASSASRVSSETVSWENEKGVDECFRFVPISAKIHIVWAEESRKYGGVLASSVAELASVGVGLFAPSPS